MAESLTAALRGPLLAAAERHRLWSPGDRILAAVSGGADSVALLLLLVEVAPAAGLQLGVAHFNHGWRPEAGSDADFVAALAARLGLPFYLGAPPSGAIVPPGNREQAGRRQRYQFLARLVAAGHGVRAATAHTADDQAETVLLRMLRGSGPAGLAGILPQRRLTSEAAQATLIRPMLGLDRAPLRQWLRQQGQPWREDASNRRLDRARNRLRHLVLPWLELEFHPRLGRRLSQVAELARAEEEYWAAALPPLAAALWRPGSRAWRASRAQLQAQPLALRRRLLRAGMALAGAQPRRLEFARVEQLLQWIAAPARPRKLRLGGVEIEVSAAFVALRPLSPDARRGGAAL